MARVVFGALRTVMFDITQQFNRIFGMGEDMPMNLQML